MTKVLNWDNGKCGVEKVASDRGSARTGIKKVVRFTWQTKMRRNGMGDNRDREEITWFVDGDGGGTGAQLEVKVVEDTQ